MIIYPYMINCSENYIIDWIDIKINKLTAKKGL